MGQDREESRCARSTSQTARRADLKFPEVTSIYDNVHDAVEPLLPGRSSRSRHTSTEPKSPNRVTLALAFPERPNQLRITDQDFSGDELSEPVDGQDAPAETSTASGPMASPSNFRTPSGQQKRKGAPNYGRDREQNDDDDGIFKRPRPNAASPPSVSGMPYQMKFACPYQKSDPKNCGTCGQASRSRSADPGFRDFHRVV